MSYWLKKSHCGDKKMNKTLVASFTKEVNLRLAKRPLVFNGRLANRGLNFLVKGATVVYSNEVTGL